jgi:hypothetical protein
MHGGLNDVNVATGHRISAVYCRYDDVPDLLRPLKGDRINQLISAWESPFNPTGNCSNNSLIVFPKVQGSTDGAAKTFSM